MRFCKLVTTVFIWVAIPLAGCSAIYRDVSSVSPYKERIGQVCEVVTPIRAHGYTFKLGRNKETDAISIWNPGFSGPEVTFVLSIQPGTKITLLEARECVNCPFDRYPEYLVQVSPEPQQFSGKPAYLRDTSLTPRYLRCASGANLP
ncbi:hypothetical protein Pcar_3405 [Syntrophotalea carbinolica DSM 2380]|uniref:Uncharacterized protein n=1 Tax=Syntrophotalea carbinolica (strain DSM 2380 / NBRC 103641 / GraBd1) TaxID=338963 RepID=Q0C6B9_SYNC1|nr:hypothetical protein Pcar_3405 [Syntrophotalea carbinolica DSM 2380]